jgi:phytoene desaturase
MTSAIVIGAGIGGIATAARLARHGIQVSVFEKGTRPGGRTSIIDQDGYHFDTGPTLFLMPEVYSETYAALGEQMHSHLDLIRLDPAYRVHFNDGTSLNISSNLVEMRAQLDAIEPGAFESYLRFIAEGHHNYQLALQNFLGRNYTSLFEYFSLQNLPLIWQMKALTRHHANVSRYFHDPRLQAAFTFQNMYLGVSPFDAPATFSLLQYTEIGDGVWFPRGGLYRVIETLAAIAEGLGVKFVYNTPVQSIEVEGNQATGVTLTDGRRIRADVIVANADLPYVYSNLLPQDGSADKLQNKQYSSSALMFYWGVKGERSNLLLHNNMFLADQQYRKSFNQIFHEHTLPDAPSFYVCTPTRTDPSFAPPDGDSLMVLVPVGHLDPKSPRDWVKLEQQARKAVLDRLETFGIRDLEERIVTETKWGPSYYEQELNLTNGSAFGLSHTFTQVGYLRPHNRHARYRNLYFAGASTHPGTGLPIVLISARLTAERILHEIPLTSSSLSYPVSKPAMERLG